MTELLTDDLPAHAPFGPSAAARLYDCPASYHVHQNKDSLDAAIGTVAHTVHENVLTGTFKTAKECVGQHHVVEVNGQSVTITVTDEMAEAVQSSIDAIHGEIALLHDRGLQPALFVEIRVDISLWTPIPNQFGTADVIVVADDTLMVFDYKHGAGVRVDAEGNLQTLLYGLGAYEFVRPLWPDIKHVKLFIHQPRNGGFSQWEISVPEMLERGAGVADRLKLCLRPDAPYNPTEKACKFCSARPVCPAYAKQMHDLYAGAFDELPLTVADSYVMPDTIGDPFGDPFDAKLLDNTDLGKLWLRTAPFKAWLESINTEVTRRLFANEPVPGLKLVEGRGSRQWNVEEQEAVTALTQLGVARDDLFEVNFLTPPKVEKLLGKEQRKSMEAIVKRKSGKPTVVAESDKRQAIDPSTLLDAFDDLDSAVDE